MILDKDARTEADRRGLLRGIGSALLIAAVFGLVIYVLLRGIAG
jgi:hypothetical protein